MGILDLLQSGDGSPNGILDFLRANALNQQMPGGLLSDMASYAQPGQSPQSAPMGFAPQPAPPPIAPNQPSPLDTAQWPAGPVGAPSNANAAMPAPQPQAAPPASPGAPPGAAPFSLGAAAGGIGDRLALGAKGFLGNLAAGPIGALAGGIGALATGERTDPAGIEAAKTAKAQILTAQALLAKGADPDEIAAAGNPELMKALVAKYYPTPSYSSAGGGNILNSKTGEVKHAFDPEESPKWAVVGKDKYGQPVYGYPPSREDYAAGKTSAETPVKGGSDSSLADVHGEDYLKQLEATDRGLASQVRAVIEGRAPYPTGMLLKTPYGQALAQHVTQADPSFEAGNAMARVKVRNEFKSGGVGSPAGQISAGNTALQHAGEMSDALERMKADTGILPSIGSSDIPYLSYFANAAHNSAIQGTSEGKAYNDFMTAKNHFSEEVTKFYAGSAGSEAERARALANLDAAKSLPELRSAIKTEANLMQGKVNALQDRWRNGMGPLVQDFPLISSESQGAVDRILQRDQASNAPPQQQPQPQAGPDKTAVEAEMRRRGLLK